MNMTMQSLCLTLMRCMKTLPLALVSALLACNLAHAAPAAAGITPLQSLDLQARQWASQQAQWRGQELALAPLDPRITVSGCQQMLQFDQPFANPSAVRARCTQPSWQLFISLVPANGASPTPASPRAAAPTVQRVLVSKELLKRGTVLQPHMFVVTEMPPAGMQDQLLQDASLVANTELVRDLLPNTPLRTYDVKKAIMVKRGQDVLVSAGQGSGFVITVKAEAQQDGGLGELIRLKNQESGRFLSAEVTGPGIAKLR